MPPPPPGGYPTPPPIPQFPLAPQFPEAPRPGSTPIDFAAMGAGGFVPQQPPRRGPRPVWLAIFIVAVLAGVGLITYGIVDLVRANNAVVDHAVARGPTNGELTTVQFVATKAQRYTVYVIIHSSDSNLRESVISDTACSIRFADGTTASITGSRQSTASTVGSVSSIGSFDAPEGKVAIRCDQGILGGVDFIVSPGSVDIFGGIGLVFGGVGALAVAVFALIKTFSKRRRGQNQGVVWVPR